MALETLEDTSRPSSGGATGGEAVLERPRSFNLPIRFLPLAFQGYPGGRQFCRADVGRAIDMQSMSNEPTSICLNSPSYPIEYVDCNFISSSSGSGRAQNPQSSSVQRHTGRIPSQCWRPAFYESSSRSRCSIRRRRAATLWAVGLAAVAVTALCFTLPLTAAATETGTTTATANAKTAPPCTVTTTSALVAALRDPRCDVLRIEGSGVSLTQSTWIAALGTADSSSSNSTGTNSSSSSDIDSNNSSHPPPELHPKKQQQQQLVLTRNVTLTGSSVRTVLDCGYLKSRIVTRPGVAIRLQGLTLSNCRAPSAIDAVGLDILSIDAGSQLLLVNVSYEVALCAPLAEVARAAAAATRPEVAPPGMQAVRHVQGAPWACPPGGESELWQMAAAAAATAAAATVQALYCTEAAVRYDDFAVNGTLLTPSGGRIPGGGLVQYIAVRQLCMDSLSPACISSLGLARCTAVEVSKLELEVWDVYDTPYGVSDLVTDLAEDGQEDEEEGGESTGVVAVVREAQTRQQLTIGLPTAIAGVAVLLVVVGLLAWTQRRKRFSACPHSVKEAYEGVVFVGLSREESYEGGQLATDATTIRSLDDITPEAAGASVTAGATAAVTLCAPKASKHTATVAGLAGDPSSGGDELLSDEAWTLPLPPNGGECGHRYLPSWDGQWDGFRHRIGGGGPNDSLTMMTNLTCSSAPAIVGILVADAPGTAAGTAATPPLRPGSGSSVSARCDGGGTAPAAADTYLPPLQHLFDCADGVASPRAARTDLVLGVDVIVTSQPVLGRSPPGSAILGQYGQVPVAVRMYHRERHLDGMAEGLVAFRRDVGGLMRRCNHPNVVALLGAGEAPGGNEVFVLEELVSTNLGRLLGSDGGPVTLTMERALSIAMDVALGLSYLHPNVLHRNLQPSSVLLDSAYNAKLADYGMCQVLDCLSGRRGHVAGTGAGQQQERQPGPRGAEDLEAARARYMAPECFVSGQQQHRQRRSTPGGRPGATPQADVYGLGVLLWEMLARETPWRDLTGAQIALAVGLQNKRLQIPINDRFPPKIRKLLLQCWEQEPRRRPSAAEVAKRLSQLVIQHRAGRR